MISNLMHVHVCIRVHACVQCIYSDFKDNNEFGVLRDDVFNTMRNCMHNRNSRWINHMHQENTCMLAFIQDLHVHMYANKHVQ